MNYHNNKDLQLLEICKTLIEEKLQWELSSTWRQRDFLNLLSLIEKESGINISLTTIRRIWSKDYHGNPQKSTLDALAIFLGYQNWLDFKTNQETTAPKVRKEEPVREKKNFSSILVLTACIIALVGIIAFVSQGKEEPLPRKAEISVKKVESSGVPNTVVFNYNLKGVDAQEYYVQQTWDINDKISLDPNDTILTRTYYYPGAHQIKVMADEKIVAETSVKINTENWVALSRAGRLDVNPVYLDIQDSNPKGAMSVSEDELIEKGIELDPGLVLSYYYVTDFENMDAENFKTRFRIKNDNFLNANCPVMWVGVIGEKNSYFAPFTKPGCVGELNFRLGTKYFKGKNHDLSNFGTDIFKWQDIAFERQGEVYTISLNEERIFSAHGGEDVGDIVGFLISFSGSGSVDYVELMNTSSDEQVYVETFN